MKYYFRNKGKGREGGDIWLFITLVPKVYLTFSYLLETFIEFLLVGSKVKCSNVPTTNFILLKGLVWWNIIEDGHTFKSCCPIPLDSWEKDHSWSKMVECLSAPKDLATDGLIWVFQAAKLIGLGKFFEFYRNVLKVFL